MATAPYLTTCVFFSFNPFCKTLIVLWVLLHKSTPAMLISKNSPGLFFPAFNIKKKKKSRISTSTTAAVVARNIKTVDIKSYFTSEKSESTCSGYWHDAAPWQRLQTQQRARLAVPGLEQKNTFCSTNWCSWIDEGPSPITYTEVS